MRVLRVLLIATLTCGSLLLLAPGAGAASTNCKALTSLQSKLDELNPKNLDGYHDVGDEFHSAAKKAKGKLKSALDDLGDTYDSIGNLSDLQDLSTSGYAKSFKTYIKAAVNCA